MRGLLRALIGGCAAAAVVVGAAGVGAAEARTLEEVLRQAASGSSEERVDAAGRLGQWRLGARGEDVRAERMLLTLLLRDREAAVRAAAATAMGQGAHGRWLGTLERVGEVDSDERVREAARQAAERVRPLTLDPSVAAGASLLLPGLGLGQHYLGQHWGGAAVAGLGLGAGVGGVLALRRLPAGGEGETVGRPLLALGQGAWIYSVFAAYRDGRLMRRDIGYRHAMTDEGLAELASAPVRPSVLSGAWFWAGLPLLVAGGIGLSELVDDDPADGTRPRLFEGPDSVRSFGAGRSPRVALGLGGAWLVGTTLPVAVGEEALFRGALQAGLEEELGDVPALALSSVLFSLAHASPGDDLGEALAGGAWRALAGAYLGYARLRTDRRISTSVALHFWYDLLLSTRRFIAAPHREPFSFTIRLPWP